MTVLYKYRPRYKSLFTSTLAIMHCMIVAAQLPNYQLNRMQEEGGLRTSEIVGMSKDKKGFMWIASQSNAYRFDGRHNVRFPFNESITRLFIDNQDRKWILTRSEAYLFSDSLRRFVQVPAGDSGRSVVSYFYESGDGSLCAIAASRHLRFDHRRQQFVTNESVPAWLHRKATRYLGQHGPYLFFAGGDSVYRYREQSNEMSAIRIDNVNRIIPLDGAEILASDTRFNTVHANFDTKEIIPFETFATASQTTIKQLTILSGVQLKSRQFLLATNKGLLEYDALTRSLRSPVFYFDGRPFENQQSTHILYKDRAGNIFMNHADGIFFLSNTADFIQYIRNYRSGNEQMPGNDTRNLAQDEHGDIWMAAVGGIARLNMQTGELKSFNPLQGKSLIDYPSYRQLLCDGRYIWIGTSGNGVWVYDKVSKACTRPSISESEARKGSVPFDEAYVWKLLRIKDQILVFGGSSVFMIDRATLTAKRILIDFNNSISRAAIQDSSGRIWHGTTKGLTCYDTGFNVLLKLRDSFPDKRIAAFCEWRKDKMLVGSKGLFEIELAGNEVIAFRRKKGIAPEQFIYCMKQDRQGYIWLGTDDGIFRYDPVRDEAIHFDRSDHVQSQAFNSDGAFMTSSGIMFMGGRNGINFFDPSSFSYRPDSLRPLVSSFTVNIDDSTQYTANYEIEYSSRNIDFVMSAPEFKKPFRLQYRYRLQADNGAWTYTGYTNHVRISRLQPGDYTLLVSASYDGKTWFDSNEPAAFTVLKPWWQTWWFRGFCVLLIALAFVLIARYRRKKRESLEMKRTVEYFTNLGSAGASVDVILWDIARNCISGLGFEDCVIYLLDEQRNVLVQKAAHGAKSPKAFEITNPIEIPIGEGITGTAAIRQVAVIVNDTSKDGRYIVDDERRLSEIAVPIVHDGRLIGVIDSEHSRKNFFTKHHLSTLQTISSLCASKIATALAVESAKNAESQLLALNGKMMESKFINLRLQMNPHFLFNILTSIQYLIVSNQVNKATRYLDIFSGFLRALLNYAEKTVVTLDEELRILTMYVELESLCLDETFIWEIHTDENIDTEEVLVPFMLLQPFVENAINHGLIHKTGEKHFSITIHEHDADSLMCVIEDNGIGRAASADINIKNLSNVLHHSRGIKIVQERLELLQQKTGRNACFEIDDLHADSKPTGTRVSIIIPYYSTEEI